MISKEKTVLDNVHTVELLSPYLESELTPTDCESVEIHLRDCGNCRQELALLRYTVDALHALPLETTSSSFAGKVAQRIGASSEMSCTEAQPKTFEPLAEPFTNAEVADPLTYGQRLQQTQAKASASVKNLLFSLLSQRIPFVDAIVVLALVVFLLQTFPEQSRQMRWNQGGEEQGQTLLEQRAIAYPSTSMPPSSVSSLLVALSPQTGDRSGSAERVAMQNKGVGEGEKVDFPLAPLATLDSNAVVVKPIVWYIAGLQFDALRKEAKRRIERIREAVIIQEEPDTFILSLPKREVTVLRKQLSELGQLSVSEAPVQPNASTTTLQLKFVPVSNLPIVSSPS